MSVRLHVLLARKAPLGVVFRRGPSKRVLLCVWHSDTDGVVEGQWLKGRVYERRCDVSPSGKRLRVRVKPFGVRPGWGEHSPLWDERVRRDGWTLESPGKEVRHPFGEVQTRLRTQNGWLI